MNILTEELPKTIEIHGKKYPVNSDFRNCLRIMLAFEDNELTQHEKQVVLLDNLYVLRPDDIQASLEEANLFLNGGKAGDGESADAPRLFSFSKDADLIFSGFRQTHGIDLQREQMHWWEFMALFMDLGADTTFCNLVGLRKRVKNGTATKEERQAAREMGEAFDIPDADTRSLSEKEQEAEFMKMVQGK